MLDNSVEKAADLTVQEAIDIWNRANPEKLIKKFLPDLADRVSFGYYTNPEDLSEYTKWYFDDDEDIDTLYDLFLKYKFNGNKDECDAFVVKLISAHEEKKAKVSEDLMSEQKKAEAEEEAEKQAEQKAVIGNLTEEESLLFATLIKDKHDTPVDIMANYEKVVTKLLCPRRNKNTNAIEFQIIPTWLSQTVYTHIMSDSDFNQIYLYVSVNFLLGNKDRLRSAIEGVADRNIYDPIIEYFETLPAWDGVPRIDGLLKKVLNIKEETYIDEEGNEKSVPDQLLKIIMTAAYRRAYATYENPVKFDQCVFIVGEQGRQKSTFTRLLSAGFYCNTIQAKDFNDNRVIMEKTENTIFSEWQEARLSGKAEKIDAIKGVFTTEQDVGRRAFAREVNRQARRAIFVLTTNTLNRSLLPDDTGNRRYIILECLPEKPEAKVYELMTPEFVKQLWAELIDRDQHGGKSIADTTNIFESSSTDYNLGKHVIETARQNLRTDDEEENVRMALTIPLPDNWNSWSKEAQRDYIRNRSAKRIGNNKVQRREVCTSMIFSELWGDGVKRMTNREAADIKNILVKLGLIEHRDRKTFTNYGQQNIWYEIPTREEYEKRYPGIPYPFEYDPSILPDSSIPDVIEQKTKEKEYADNESRQKISLLEHKMQYALAALEKGDIEAAKRFLNDKTETEEISSVELF